MKWRGRNGHSHGGKKGENKRKSSFSGYSLAIINNAFPKYCTLYKLSSAAPVVLRKRLQKSILIPVVKIGFLQYFSFLALSCSWHKHSNNWTSKDLPTFWGDRTVSESIPQWNPALGWWHCFGATAVPCCWHPYFPHLHPTGNTGGRNATLIRKVRTEHWSWLLLAAYTRLQLCY